MKRAQQFARMAKEAKIIIAQRAVFDQSKKLYEAILTQVEKAAKIGCTQIHGDIELDPYEHKDRHTLLVRVTEMLVLDGFASVDAFSYVQGSNGANILGFRVCLPEVEPYWATGQQGPSYTNPSLVGGPQGFCGNQGIQGVITSTPSQQQTNMCNCPTCHYNNISEDDDEG